MDELFLGIPVLYWVIGAAALVALIVIIVIICCVINAKNKKAKSQTAKPVAQPAAAKTEEPAKVEKKEEEKPTAKPAATKSTTKTASTEKKPAAKAAPAKEEPAKPTVKTYHVSKRKDDNMWQIKAAGGAKAIKLFKTQKEAIDYCKNLADNQDANIMIHKEDGSFRKLTY